ncbi:MAG: hypothetical protein L0K42_07330, partial [Acidipropionibacterium jensenii]|uniref:hypothetical protein n=1 Tax=Acidipropionibacterium jensenii TaxID=1749 RepID=UPI002648DE26
VCVANDALAVSRPLHSAIRAAVRQQLPGATVLVSASHTHSAPGAWCGTIHPLLPAALDLAQIDAVAQQLGSALPPVRSVDLVRGVASVTGVGTNRNDPARPVDTTVDVLAALLPGNHSAGPIGLIVDHACHPTVLGPDSTAWSPDWVTGLRDGLETSLGAVPVLFLQGAAGDVSTRFTRRCPTTAEAIRIGRRVAAGALSALESARPVDPAAGIGGHRHVLVLNRRDAEAELATIDPPGSTTAGADSQQLARSQGLAGLRALAAHPGPHTLIAPVHDLRIGSVRYLAVPVELPNDWGRRLATAGDLQVIGYTDDYLGYLADEDAHRAGSYEATSSYADAAEARRLLSELTAIATLTGPAAT